MNNRALTLSLVMGGLAIFFVQSYVSSIEEEAKKKFGTEVLAVVARRDVKEMETLNETLVEFKNIPKTFLEPAAITSDSKDENSKESAKTLKEIMGTVAIVSLKKGEQITFNKITDPSLRTGLAPQVTPTRRAVAVAVNESTGVSKLIKPGDRVDLIAILDPGGGKNTRLAKTLFQDVIVLSIGRYITNNVARTIEADPAGGKDRVRSLAEDFSFATVTLEVDPSQAQELALVASNSDNALVLTLRNNEDSERVILNPTNVSDLMVFDPNRRGNPQLLVAPRK